ncbi:MAG: cob(I)yrinic acid a,c-diamide adenosyltransferase [Planctomycetota bacterium]|jgi:cob(I)alamin adenosyltransferase
MKLYTKRGDDGRTALGDGQRVGKDDLRVSAYGEVDELNAALGLVRAGCQDAAWNMKLRHVQDRLFALGADLADPAAGQGGGISDADVTYLEGWIDEAAGQVAPLKNFILPGGSELAARLHSARTVCRRAERSVVRLAGAQPIVPCAVPFLNRLGDLLFAWARLANKRDGVEDVIWRSPPGSGDGARSDS